VGKRIHLYNLRSTPESDPISIQVILLHEIDVAGLDLTGNYIRQNGWRIG
jgi:hypothetical protein